MKLVNFIDNAEVHVGVVTEEGVADLTEAVRLSGGDPALGKMEALIAAGVDGIKRAADIARTAPKKSLDGLTFAPVVTTPEKILCIGLNYLAHAAEESETLPPVPEVFSKFNTSLAAHEEDIPLPAAANRFDYEAELVVVIGAQARCVSKERALDHVFGYTVGNDISAREQQFRITQWLIGKSPDKFGPVGPFIVTRDAVDGGNLTMRLWCNGELRQDANTRDLIFDIPTLVSYISQFITLNPGDLIFTGTSAGVINGMKGDADSKPWLKPGDEVIVEIEGIGRLRNVMAAPLAAPRPTPSAHPGRRV